MQVRKLPFIIVSILLHLLEKGICLNLEVIFIACFVSKNSSPLSSSRLFFRVKQSWGKSWRLQAKNVWCMHSLSIKGFEQYGHLGLFLTNSSSFSSFICNFFANSSLLHNVFESWRSLSLIRNIFYSSSLIDSKIINCFSRGS